MAQIREIKKRIKSVENTQKVTHAMELVSAAKMRKAQSLALAGRPYSASLAEILSSVNTASSAKIVNLLLVKKTSPNQLIIIVTPDRGLTGGLNINIFREVLRSEIKNAKYITVGKKARDFVVKTNGELLASWESEELEPLPIARLITKIATDGFKKDDFSKVSLVYPHFESTVKQTPKWLNLLPVEDIIEGQKDERQEFLFEPRPDEILDAILAHHILTQIYQVLVEAKASEHSARMVAMKNATDAADDLVKDLTLTYNQARQEAITKELLDIVTAQKAFS